MVGKRRYYNPNSAAKVALNVYNIASARAGVYATESPFLQMMIYEYAKNAAQRWDEIGSWAATTYRQIVSKYDLAPYQRAAVRALIGKASKYVQAAKRGIKVDKDDLYIKLKLIQADLGIDVPNEIIEAIVRAATG